jgi:hypothetical protein
LLMWHTWDWFPLNARLETIYAYCLVVAFLFSFESKTNIIYLLERVTFTGFLMRSYQMRIQVNSWSKISPYGDYCHGTDRYRRRTPHHSGPNNVHPLPRIDFTIPLSWGSVGLWDLQLSTGSTTKADPSSSRYKSPKMTSNLDHLSFNSNLFICQSFRSNSPSFNSS